MSNVDIYVDSTFDVLLNSAGILTEYITHYTLHAWLHGMVGTI